jgi:hypothetical protein
MIPANAALLAWFLAKYPAYNNPQKYANFTITAANRTQPTLTLELLEGSLQDWMRQQLPTYDPVFGLPVWSDNPDNVYSYSDREDIITITVAYTVLENAGQPVRAVTDEVITTRIIATDCPTGRYSRLLTDSSGGESIPQNLAQALYNDLNAPHYAGQVKIVSEDVAGTAQIGAIVHITGGDSAWASMLACIQSISEHLDSGATTINVGPPDHLTPSGILDLRRANRVRKPSTSFSGRVSGQVSGGTVDLSSAMPKSDSGHGPGRWGVRQSFITAIKVEDDAIKIKTRTAVVQYLDAESDWTIIEGGQGESCDGST